MASSFFVVLKSKRRLRLSHVGSRFSPTPQRKMPRTIPLICQGDVVMLASLANLQSGTH
jgi:hypothetical protein